MFFATKNRLCKTPFLLCNHDEHGKNFTIQGAKKIIFTACHLGKLKLVFTSPDVISTSPKSFLMSRIDFAVLLLFEFLKKNITCPSGKLKTEFTSPIAKFTSPRLLDTTFFTHCHTCKPCALLKFLPLCYVFLTLTRRLNMNQ